MGKKTGLGGGNGGSGGRGSGGSGGRGSGGGKRNWLGLRSGLGLGLGGKSSSSLGALKRRMSFQVGTLLPLQTNNSPTPL